MSEPAGEFAHRHVATSYSAREGGGVVSHTDWEGVATDLPPMVVPVLMRELDTFLRSQARPA